MRYTTKIVLFALISFVKSDGITLGSERGRKIYDEDTTANPAIWRQVNNISITAGDNDVISGVTITDLREDKKGEAVVVDGGIGEKNITIELKSPTALRGYEFHIQAYALPENEASKIKKEAQEKTILDTTKPNYQPIPRIATDDGNTPNQPAKPTSLADLEKTENKREVTTEKTIRDHTVSSTSKYPSTKALDQTTKTASLQKTENKRSADDLNTKLTTEDKFTSSTPQYHTTPIKTIPFDHIDDENKDTKPSATPNLARDFKLDAKDGLKPEVKDGSKTETKDGLRPDAKDQSSLKMSRSIHDETPSTKDAKPLDVSTNKPVPVHQFIMTNPDSAKTNDQSDEVPNFPIEIKTVTSTTESNKGETSSTPKVYTHKPL